MFFWTFKKGFTLVELLAVIILLGLLGLIIYPTVNGVINTNKQKLHNKQIEELIRHANTYATTNITKLKTVDGARNVITLTDLYEAGIIQNDKVVDPSNDEELTGCMALTWKESTNSFDIQYIEDCNNSFNLSGKVTITAPFSTVNNSNPTVQLLQGNQVMYETIALDDGSYEFNNVDGGTYLILVSKPTRTKYGREIEILSNVTKDINALLYVGDLNEDDFIDNFDMKLFDNSKCFNKLVTTNPECAKYDLDDNGVVTANDSNVLVSSNNFGKSSDFVYNGTGKLTGKVIYDGVKKPSLLLYGDNGNYDITIKDDGRFEVNNLENGVYILRTNPDISLRNSYTYFYKGISIKGDTEIIVTLYVGDVITNGTIDEDDQTYLEEYLESGKVPTEKTLAQYDYNDDKKIDNKDLTILKNNLGKEAKFQFKN